MYQGLLVVLSQRINEGKKWEYIYKEESKRNLIEGGIKGNVSRHKSNNDSNSEGDSPLGTNLSQAKKRNKRSREKISKQVGNKLEEQYKTIIELKDKEI